MNRLHHKIVSLFVVFGLIFFSAALPIKLADYFERKGKRGVAVLSFLMCFGGGVFFGTFLVNMIPEVHEKIDDTILKPNDMEYPLGELIIGLGFFMMMFLEKAVIEAKNQKDKKDAEKQKSVQVEHGMTDVQQRKNGAKQETVSVVAIRQLEPDEYHNKDGHHEHGHHDQEHHDQEHDEHKHDEHEHDEGPEHHHLHEQHHDHEEGHVHDHHDHHEGPHSHAEGSAAKSLVLLLALSIDCIFEGLSLSRPP